MAMEIFLKILAMRSQLQGPPGRDSLNNEVVVAVEIRRQRLGGPLPH